MTGVSGSGKSTLINDTPLPRNCNPPASSPGPRGRPSIQSWASDAIDKVVDVSQAPIGRTPRSNPATYTGALSSIRQLFSQVPEARVRGYAPGRFSFNVKGGRCEACHGDGTLRVEMHFLPDIFVTCEECAGRRYNRETLEIRYKGYSIADVLEMTVEEALGFAENVPSLRRPLKTLLDVGLGYLHVGQSATTLSGGEAQRVKLAKELSRRDTGRTLYLLDEPTTGLHFADVEQLLGVLDQLVEKGNTVGRHRAPSGCDQDGRLRDRPGSRGRRRRRRDRHFGYTGRGCRVLEEPHRDCTARCVVRCARMATRASEARVGITAF